MAETIKGLNIKLSLDASELNDKLSNLTKTLKEEELNLRAINKSLKFDPTNIELWKSKQDTLNQAISLTNERVTATKARLSDAKKELEVGALGEKEFNKLARSVLYAETDIKRFNLELSKVKNELKKIENTKFDNLSKIGKTLSKQITAPIIGIINALKDLSIASLNATAYLKVTADKLNMSVESFQEFNYIAKNLSIDQAKLVNGFKEVNKILGSIASGDITEVNEKLKTIGLTSKDLEGLSVDKAFLKIRDAISKLDSTTLKTNAAIKIFGNNVGPDLITLLNLSSSEVNNLKEEVNELGIVTSEDANIAREFQKELIKIETAFKNIGFELAKILLPCINLIVDVIQNKVIPILKDLINWWNELDKVDKALIVTFGLIAISIGPILSAIGSLIPLLNSLKVAFTTTAGSIMIFGHAIKISTLGIAALVAAIAVILLQNEKFRETLAKLLKILGDILNIVMAVVEKLINALMPIVEVLLSFINKIIDSLMRLIDKLIGPLERILDTIMKALEGLVPIIEKIVSSLISVLIPVIDTLTTIIEPIIDLIEIIIDVILNVVEVITNILTKSLNNEKNILEVIIDVVGTLINILGKIIQTLANILAPILRIIMKLLEPIIKIVTSIIEIVLSLFESLMPIIEVLLLPLTIAIETLVFLLSQFEPILTMLLELLEEVLVPILEVLFILLEPFIEIISLITEAITWLFDVLFGGLEEGSGMVSGFTNLFQNSFFSSISNIIHKFLEFFSFVVNGIKGVVNNIANFATDIGNFLSNLLTSFVDWLGNIFNKIGNFFKGVWDTIVGWFGGGDKNKEIEETNRNIQRSNEQLQSANYQVSNVENRQITNYLTINTTSPTIDIDDINRQLGGNYL